MRVEVQQPYTLAELMPKLQERFPEYQFSFRGPKVIVIGRGKIAGALIVGEKKKFVRINEGFPTMGGQLLFLFSILMLGVLIPFVVYLAAMKPKQVKLRNNVADYIRMEYGEGMIGHSTELLDDNM